MAITKALSDPNRVRMLLALRHGELCVCQITELFGFAPSTISKHLSILHQAHLILSRKSERWVYYRLPDKTAPVAVRDALDWVHKSLAKTDETHHPHPLHRQLLPQPYWRRFFARCVG